MRRSLIAGAFLLPLLLLGASRDAVAQSGATGEGALQFIIPAGARAVGMGQTIAATVSGAEAVWWNPALIARSGREAALFVRNKANAADAETDAGAAFVWQFPKVGAAALSLRYINLATEEVTNTGGQDVVGSAVISAIVFGGTFATTFGDRLAVGFTAKHLVFTYDCTGSCDQAGVRSGSQPSVSALDFGGQYFITRDSTIAIGAGVRNIGPKLQVLDSPQSDPLPARGDFGVQYAPRFPTLPDIRVRAGADITTRLMDGTGPGFRLGAEVGYRERYFGRAGYMYKGPGEISSPTLGFGVVTGKLEIDLAQQMTDAGTQGSRPTFLSLRYLF